MVPDTATALGVNLGLSSNTRWLDRIASMPSTSAMKTVPSGAAAIERGWDAVSNKFSLQNSEGCHTKSHFDIKMRTYTKLDPSGVISRTLSSRPAEKALPSDATAIPATTVEWGFPAT